ncbi:ATP-binding cassette domain-containing protein [Frankia sp. AgB32]|uniref:ATP-binding cassette domain-containing protein n=1 Tax=Frankia sp. AgB32 TaxID=631119 RepID=UPI00200C26B6|nr:ATP-binding cassette domain-containing protein [Frankia sp. AgB32]MCK9894263.1 ATP-binding cassette domain-containing protein [Frankia sp. AgB32]
MPPTSSSAIRTVADEPPKRLSASGSAAPAVEAHELVKTYPGRRGAPPVRALSGAGFTVPAGTVFGLLGPNGAGKSTTVRILTTLTSPDGGRASVAGYDVRRQAGRVRRAIGVVTQKSGVDPEATGRENLVLQAYLHGLTGRAARSRVSELLDQFDLAAPADRLARTYSGGMLRRLDVAIGLVHRPAVLFLDEPTTGLDPQARSAMWAEISRLTTEGLTILLTTHYLEEADRLAARVALIEGGRIVVEGSPDGLKSELRGDALELELAGELDDSGGPGPAAVTRLRERLLALDAVHEVRVVGRRLHARVADGAGTLPAVFAAVGGTGLAVSSATVARPSLDDVYLRYVGHRFTADTGAGTGTAREAGR